ncbi:MAG: cell division protein FtsZ [Bacteriovoracaceae bacterium]|nr:cell division protein FtsZ [Bacteriovoracaceae bacterium]
MLFDIDENEIKTGAKIKVIGVGGGGCNAVNTMIRHGLSGVEYIVANTDAQALQASLAPVKIQLGSDVTKGLGAGANPEVGRKAAIDDYDKLSEALKGADMVFVTAGMGGGTGTGAAPVIAKLCRELEILTVGVVTKPFFFEGKKRTRQAEVGIQALEETVDSLICIPNQRLLQLAGESLSLVETFKKADEVLLNAVQGISDLINNTGLINADFADVSTVMANKGLALMGTGMASGTERAVKAAKQAISSPLLEDITIDGATGIIINITGSSTLTTFETNEAVTLIMQAADEDAEIIFGTVIDDTIGDSIKITVIATGLRTEAKLEDVAPSYLKQSAPTKERRDEVRMASKLPEAAPMMESSKPQAFNMENLETPAYSARKVDAVVKSEISYNVDAEIRQAAATTPANTDMNGRPRFNLAQSLKEAANKYEAKKANIEEPTPSKPVYRDEPQTTHFEVSKEEPVKETRVKSIAEKLGFMNFDEDEFDTPSFLKKERNVDSSLN